jgi:hypothetical protein
MSIYKIQLNKIKGNIMKFERTEDNQLRIYSSRTKKTTDLSGFDFDESDIEIILFLVQLTRPDDKEALVRIEKEYRKFLESLKEEK